MTLDPSMIVELRDLDAEGGGISQLVQSFLVHLAADLEELRGGVERADATLVAELCHRLQGSSGGFGASTMAGMFAELERTTRTAFEGAPDILRHLEAELSRVRPALTAAFPVAPD